MISRIHGTIEGFSARGVYVRIGDIVCEILLTGGEKQEIELRPLGEKIALHTLLILEGKAGGGSLSPILLGFQQQLDREFFELFISVEGIGISSALKMLTAPIPQVARAIEDNNLTFLCTLKQVGPRTARKIVAKLMGKAGRYTAGEIAQSAKGTAGADNPPAPSKSTDLDDGNAASASTERQRQTAAAKSSGRQDPDRMDGPMALTASEQLKAQATEILEQLGYTSYEAKRMLARIFENSTHFTTVEDILTEIYRGDLPAPRSRR